MKLQMNGVCTVNLPLHLVALSIVNELAAWITRIRYVKEGQTHLKKNKYLDALIESSHGA